MHTAIPPPPPQPYSQQVELRITPFLLCLPPSLLHHSKVPYLRPPKPPQKYPNPAHPSTPSNSPLTSPAPPYPARPAISPLRPVPSSMNRCRIAPSTILRPTLASTPGSGPLVSGSRYALGLRPAACGSVVVSWAASDERRRYDDSGSGRRAARTPVGDARRSACAGASLSPPLAGATGRSRELVGWWAPVLKEVRCRRRWPWRDLGSGWRVSRVSRRGKGGRGITYALGRTVGCESVPLRRWRR